ncbi:hypothetical protein B9Z19DRAFT_1129210 [Tuber borchii]|uniref:Uncharacterized protein n=1 Tax=Tuber borchii TaxID=42251 RepID=A0A2T6ZMR6_TUBBO|nr:hypothetical protein B9Z19DRAFT_1129210 [Tuber borchii]
MGKREEQMKGKVGALESENEAIKLTVTEAEEKAKKLSEAWDVVGVEFVASGDEDHDRLLEALKAKPIETETSIRKLIFEKGAPGKKSRNLEGRVNDPDGGLKTRKCPNVLVQQYLRITPK